MIVVSDTSPLNYLVHIEFQHILPELFGQILIPQAVRDELQSPVAPDVIKRFLASEPPWLELRASPAVGAPLPHLDPGERETIALALATLADVVLLDERKGRQAARKNGLVVSGTLGVLELAAQRGLVTWSEALTRLSRTNFRASPRLLRQIRNRFPP